MADEFLCIVWPSLPPVLPSSQPPLPSNWWSISPAVRVREVRVVRGSGGGLGGELRGGGEEVWGMKGWGAQGV